MASETSMRKFEQIVANAVNCCFLPPLVGYINNRTSTEPLTVEECVRVLEMNVDRSATPMGTPKILTPSPQMIAPSPQIVAPSFLGAVPPPVAQNKSKSTSASPTKPTDGYHCIYQFPRGNDKGSYCNAVLKDTSIPYCNKHAKTKGAKPAAQTAQPGLAPAGVTVMREISAGGLVGLPPAVPKVEEIAKERISEWNVYDKTQDLLIHPVYKFVAQQTGSSLVVVGKDMNGHELRKLTPEEKETASKLNLMVNEDIKINPVGSNNFVPMLSTPQPVNSVPQVSQTPEPPKVETPVVSQTPVISEPLKVDPVPQVSQISVPEPPKVVPVIPTGVPPLELNSVKNMPQIDVQLS